MMLARLYLQVNRWVMNLSPWRYAALMASAITSGSALGPWLVGTDRRSRSGSC